ncbi:MAG: hypothetical protein JWN13_6632 [Betaproteobacteria bacterium]|nr:hypothetical protein [Betaproteobacteria bacterium]MEA3157917.1 hypothetical protein [Betaproteobacteria bacterium]
MKSMLLTAAVAAAFASLAPVAMALSGDAPVVAQAPQQRAQEGSAVQRQASARRFRTPSERVEARLAYARTALKITDAQQPQWENFANVLRKQARAMDQRFQERHARSEAARGGRGEGAQGARRPDGRSVTAIDRLERTQQRMAERSARLNEVLTAAKPLYAALSPEQKQIADGMLAHQGRGGHGQHDRGMNRGPAA